MSETTLLKKQGQERHSGKAAKRKLLSAVIVHSYGEHRIVAPTIPIRTLKGCRLNSGRAAL